MIHKDYLRYLRSPVWWVLYREADCAIFATHGFVATPWSRMVGARGWALPCTPETAYSTLSNCRIQVGPCGRSCACIVQRHPEMSLCSGLPYIACCRDNGRVLDKGPRGAVSGAAHVPRIARHATVALRDAMPPTS